MFEKCLAAMTEEASVVAVTIEGCCELFGQWAGM